MAKKPKEVMPQQQLNKGKNNKGKRGGHRSQSPSGSKLRDNRRDGSRSIKDVDAVTSTPFSTAKNDFAWYNQNPQLTVAAGSIPFPYRPGMELPTGQYLFQGKKANGNNFPIPGVITLTWMPSIGPAEGPLDPASIAAKELYARVRAAYSGSLAVDPPDLVIYLLALDSIFSYIAYLKRLYRIITAYSPDNMCTPNTLLHALNVTDAGIKDLQENQMQLFQYINELVLMTRKFRCPAVFTLFNRHYWMNDNVYADAPSANSQWYMFVQHTFLKFSLVNTPQSVPAGGLTHIAVSNTPPTGMSYVDYLYNTGKELISALAASEDAYTISGYLERAFQGVPSFAVDELQYSERLTPVFEPEVLAQIENAHACPREIRVDYTNSTISQDPTTNAVKQNLSLTVESDASYLLTNPIISIRSDSPTVPEVVEATRLKTFVNPQAGTVTSGTEFLLTMNMWQRNPITGADNMYSYPSGDIVDVTVDNSALNPTALAVLSNFDWRPITDMMFTTAAGTATGRIVFAGDLHNVTVITEQQLQNLHRVCLFSEFGSFGQI